MRMLVDPFSYRSAARRHASVLAICAVIAIHSTPSTAFAQNQSDYVQTGMAAAPGIGMQVGYVSIKAVHTVEGMLYLDTAPRFAGGDGKVTVSTGIGGSIRVMGIIRTISGPTSTRFDADIGVRLGPGLTFAPDETRAEKNQRFGLFIEPFVRVSRPRTERVTYYVEIGLHNPGLRAGVVVKL